MHLSVILLKTYERVSSNRIFARAPGKQKKPLYGVYRVRVVHVGAHISAVPIRPRLRRWKQDRKRRPQRRSRRLPARHVYVYVTRRHHGWLCETATYYGLRPGTRHRRHKYSSGAVPHSWRVAISSPSTGSRLPVLQLPSLMTHLSKQALSESHVYELALFLSYIVRSDPTSFTALI